MDPGFLYKGENSLNIEEVIGRGGQISIILTGHFCLDITVIIPDFLFQEDTEPWEKRVA